MENKEFEETEKNRPHVVILGAGASCAAIPDGDKNGKKISAMEGFVEKLELTHILKDAKLKTTSTNLEDIYMELEEKSVKDGKYSIIKKSLENNIYRYIKEFEIPDDVTIYDLLILSLTEKDIIASFNWDPLLHYAMYRVSKIASNIPNIVYLHGNVVTGVCEVDNIIGINGNSCKKCGKTYKKSRLLYPIKNKNYTSDDVIHFYWQELQEKLDKAHMLTIFGYSAPKSDQAAIDLLRKAWGNPKKSNLKYVEIIDIKDEETVIETWSQFINKNKYLYHDSFFLVLLLCFQDVLVNRLMKDF